METNELIQLIEAAGYDVRRRYSGRGMYGKECVGFVGNDNPMDMAVRVMCEAAQADCACEVADLFLESRSDSMGRGTIIYFPGMKYIEEDEEEDDDD